MKAAIDSTYTRTLNDMTMVFLKYIGLPVPCDSSVQLVQDLLKNMIAKATFDLSDADENGNITVRVHPVTVLVDLAQDLDDYYYDFYLRNNSLEFSELSDEQFEKTYLDQVITMFETQLIGADTDNRYSQYFRHRVSAGKYVHRRRCAQTADDRIHQRL